MTPEPSDRADRARAFESKRRVEFFRRNKSARRAAQQNRLQISGASHAARKIDHFAQSGAKRNFIHARLRNVSGKQNKSRAGRLLRAESCANAAPPSRIIPGILMSVSTLFTTVGWRNRPDCVGNGGLLRGSPR